MKVITNVTIEVKGEKGRQTLAPGEHNLSDAIAKELIDGGYAQVPGKNAPAAASTSTPPQADPNGNKGDFDVALLEGTVPDISAALQAGEFTAEHLDALAAAEQEREKPRVGVIEAIAEAKEALAGK